MVNAPSDNGQYGRSLQRLLSYSSIKLATLDGLCYLFMLNNDLERMWKEALLEYFEVLS
jgi:hypothetical protein